MTKWRMIVDVARCHDCNNCFLACKDEHVGNDWPPFSAAQPAHGQRWMNVIPRERGGYPLVEVAYLPQPCLHCQEAPCVRAAREGEIRTRPDGIVVIDPVKAKGRKELVEACPFGAIFWNEDLSLPQKCTLCVHLLEEGWAEPRCVQACPTGALKAVKAGEEEWAGMIEAQKLEPLRPELKTGPLVRYRNLDRFTLGFVAGTVAFKADDECAPGVLVRALDPAGQEVARAETDSYGDFKLRGLAEDGRDLVLELSSPGLETQRLEVKLEKSANLGTVFL